MIIAYCINRKLLWETEKCQENLIYNSQEVTRRSFEPGVSEHKYSLPLHHLMFALNVGECVFVYGMNT
jgi:hypothetical protein